MLDSVEIWRYRITNLSENEPEYWNNKQSLFLFVPCLTCSCSRDPQSDFCTTLKNGFSKCSLLFVLSANKCTDQKHGLFVFPPKKTLIWRRHCSIGQLCCSMTSRRSIEWFLESSSGVKFFSPEHLLNQPKATRVCIRSLNQSNRSISLSFVVSVLFARFHFKAIRKSPFGTSTVNRCKLISGWFKLELPSESFKIFFYLFSPYFVTLESLRLPQNNAKCRKINWINVIKNVEALSRRLLSVLPRLKLVSCAAGSRS